jgi:hypothetical protein
MVSDQEWFKKASKGKVSINSVTIYRALSFEIVQKVAQNITINEIINWIKSKTIETFKQKYGKIPEMGALNNAAGRWNEFLATSLISEIVLEMNQEIGKTITIFSLPNSQIQKENSDEVSSKFLSLFCNDDFATGNPLENLAPFKEQIFFPSPDYIIAVLEGDEISKSVESLLQKQARDPESLELYNSLKGKLHIAQVKAVVSLKTTNRPDRRYQPLFEAAMIKAMSYAVQQKWQYYMVVSELSPADKTIFNKAITPHGIAIKQNSKMVDCTYLYTRKEDLKPLIEAAIKENN